MKQDLERYRAVLERSDMFRGIDGDRLAGLLDGMRARVVRYAKSETVYRVGDEVVESALVLEGTVVVDASDAEGDDTNLNMLRKGDEFGSFIVLSGSQRSPMHVYASTRCVILFYDLRAASAKRARDEADRRKVLLTLTVAGEAKIVRQEHKSQLPVRYTQLDDSELDRLAEALEKVIKGWKEDGVPERELFAPGDRR